MVDASQVAIADDGVDIGLSDNASVQFLDNPTNNAATGVATDIVSAFQTDHSVLRVVRYLSWALLRDDAVGFIELPIGGSPA